MKITRIFGVVSLIVFLAGVGIVASHDVTLARENGQSENASTSAQVVNRASGDEQGNALITDVDDEGESRTGNVTVSGNRNGKENDDINEGGQLSARSRQPVPPAVTPPPVNPPAPSSNATLVSYSAVIQPIFNQRCNSCHPKPGVNLSTYAGTKAAVGLLPGMGQGYLSSAELQSLLTWIQQGSLNN